MPSTLADVAPAFVAMAHRIVWCSVATVDAKQAPPLSQSSTPSGNGKTAS